MTNSSNVSEKAHESAKKAKQAPECVQYAIIHTLANTVNGAFWGFASMKDVEQHIGDIKESQGNIVVRKLGSDDCLIEVEPNFLVNSIAKIDPDAMTFGDLQNFSNKRAEATVGFEKFLIAQGKKGFSGTIGIYCINEVSTIIYKGTNYPAFRVNMMTALSYMGHYGYAVKINGQFILASNAGQAGQALWDSLILSPTKTGLFIDVKSTYNLEQMKELEQQFKVRYKKK